MNFSKLYANMAIAIEFGIIVLKKTDFIVPAR